MTKGAPQALLSLVCNAEDVRPQVEGIVQQFADQGYSCLAVAVSFTDDDGDNNNRDPEDEQKQADMMWQMIVSTVRAVACSGCR